MLTLIDRIRNMQLEFTYEHGTGKNKPAASVNSNNWIVKIKRDRKSIKIPFYTGFAIPYPDLLSVLDCLFSDRTSLLNARNVNDFMCECGYTDYKQAEKIMKAIERNNKKLEHLFSKEELDNLTYRTERL
jgi:hypothetical protein